MSDPTKDGRAKDLIAMLRQVPGKRKVTVEIVGCSLCVRLVLKKGRKPAPCPVCGALVSRKKARIKR